MDFVVIIQFTAQLLHLKCIFFFQILLIPGFAIISSQIKSESGKLLLTQKACNVALSPSKHEKIIFLGELIVALIPCLIGVIL